MKKHLVDLLKQEKFIKHGKFTLRNGEVSDHYCDIKQILGSPKILNILVKELVKKIPKEVTCIAGSGYGGIVLATLVSYKKKIPIVLVRDKVKNHGTKKLIDGYIPGKKDITCIVDDVFTTGSSISDTQKKLRKTGTKFTKPIVVLNRSKNKSIICLITEGDLILK